MKIYQENIERYDAKISDLNKVLNKLSLLRILIFGFSAIILIYLFGNKLFTPFFIVLPISIIGFAAVLKHHTKIATSKKHTSLLKKINESEILREEGNLQEFDPGQIFINPNHPYTSDLDIFGQHSIFQLVNRTTTESGMIVLSKWLSEPASNYEIDNRQKAIKEVSQKIDWMQDFQASGMQFQNKKSDYYKLMKWVDAPVVLLKNKLSYLSATIILPILFLLFTYFFYANLGSQMGIIYLALMVLVLIINAVIIKNVRPIAEDIVETSILNLYTLRGYKALINKIENERFKSEKLFKLQSLIKQGKYSACKEIDKLCNLLDFSHQRPIKKIPISGNGFYLLLNSIFLLDIHLIIGSEKWKSKNKDFLRSWADLVSEFEVINSFAGFCYSNPSFTFPEITEKNNYVHFELLGHPLINSDERIYNDFHSESGGEITMITGSNMGGKSTFLRAVGVNIVLGLAGAPCCSTKSKISNLHLFSSMRTEDNLKKGISSFYAELNRIEKMLKLIENSNNVFFLLDEVFKGTNSEDRHKGGFSLINQVSKLQTSGIIATHDIELAKLAGNKSLVTNYSFNSEIKDGAMIFSYKLDPGICTDFNASELMKKIGIKILPDNSKINSNN